jgi:hypothetical protein
MAEFSDDGQWWWDGQQWIATSQVVIPDLPPTARGQELEPAVKRYRLLDDANLYSYAVPSGGLELLWVPWLIFQKRAFRAYREWALERVKTAATYLVGPNEPVLAAEVGMYNLIVIGYVWGGLAVVVTPAHVLILANDKPLGSPRRVLLVARPSQVAMQVVPGGILNAYPTIVVSFRGQTWEIKGMNRVIKPQPVIAAWYQLAVAAAMNQKAAPAP